MSTLSPKSRRQSSRTPATSSPSEETITLHKLISAGEHSKAKALLKKGASISETDALGWNALHVAAFAANYKTLATLLSRKGVNIHALTKNEESIFSFLARQSDFDPNPLIQCLRTLLSLGADPAVPDSVLYTPLHYACDTGNVETVEFFLKEAQVNPNVPNCVGNTPLHLAAQKGRSDVVSLLLAHGDYASVRNHRGLLPTDVAQQLNFDSIARQLREHVKKVQVTSQWHPFRLHSPLPSRFNHSATLVDDTVWVVGGTDQADVQLPNTYYHTTLLLIHLRTGRWEEITEPSLPPLACHSATLLGTTIYLAGGYTSGWQGLATESGAGVQGREPNRAIYTLDVTTRQWEKINVYDDDAHTHHPSVCISRLNVLFFSWRPDSQALSLMAPPQDKPAARPRTFNMIHLYDIKNNAWLPLPTIASGTTAPPYRERYVCCKVGDRVILFGGVWEEHVYDDLWCFDVKANSWTAMFPGGFRPTPRSCHTAVLRGEGDSQELMVAGGLDAEGQPLSDLYGLNIQKNLWVNYTFDGRPLPPRQGLHTILLWEPKESPSSSTPTSPPRSPASPSSHLLLWGGVEEEDNTSPIISIGKPNESPSTPRGPPGTKSGDKGRSHRLLHHSSGKSKRRKITQENMMNSVFLSEEYSDELVQGVMHLMSLLQPFLDPDPEAPPEDEETRLDRIQELTGLCNELREYTTNEKPESFLEQIKLKQTAQSHRSRIRPALGINMGSLRGNSGKNSPSPSRPPPRPPRQAIMLNLPAPFTPRDKPTEWESLSTSRRQRWHIVNEILATEVDYVRDLGTVVGVYMRPLLAEDLINTYDFQSIFKNTEALFEMHKRFLEELTREYEQPEAQQDFGQLLLRYREDFQKYLTYCANQVTADATLQRLTEESSELVAFLDRAYGMEVNRGQTLESFLIRPFQRICRYPLLLKELYKHTPESWTVPRQHIQQSIADIGVIVRAANESKKQTDNLVELMNIQNQFELGPGDGDLMQMHRWHLIKEGPLRSTDRKKLSKGLHFILFQEYLVIAQPVPKNKGKLRRIYTIPTHNILIFDTKDKKSAKTFSFSVVDITSSVKVDVACLSAEEKAEWIDLINGCDGGNGNPTAPPATPPRA